jgi:methionine biosynthesis protein MetW
MTEQDTARLVGRPDYDAIAACVRPNTSVLDLGCGDGVLLRFLKDTRNVRGYGVERDAERVTACVTNGISVIQGDLENGLKDFDSGSFDYVILSLTLQAVQNTAGIVNEMLRVGREAIVTFPNFGHWPLRLQVLRGVMPRSDDLPFDWYNTPNVHLCTIYDFERFCAEQKVHVLERIVLHDGEQVSFMPNLRGSLAVFRFERGRA